jgi:hypothetical protein
MDRIERQCFVRPALQLSSFVIGQGDRKPHPDSPERMQKRKGRPDVCLYASLSISVIGAVPNSRPANKTCEGGRIRPDLQIPYGIVLLQPDVTLRQEGAITT